MDYIKIKKNLEKMSEKNYKEFVKGFISFEKNINDEDLLDYLYEEFMESDMVSLLDDDFEYMLKNLE